MDLVGEISINNDKYVIAFRDNKTTSTWILYNRYQQEDRRRIAQGVPVMNLPLTLDNFKTSGKDKEYVMEALRRVKSTGVISYFKNSFILTNFMTEFSKIQTFKFPEGTVYRDQVIEDEVSGEVTHEFEAETEDMVLVFKKVDGVFESLAFRTPLVTVDFKLQQRIPISMKELNEHFVEMKKERQKTLSDSMLKSMDYKTLRTVINLDWYEDESGVNKNYIPIHTKEDFEEFVINDLRNEIIRCQFTGEKLEVGFDTETTGLTFMNLSRDNPLLDRLVCISMSWRDNTSVLIFIEMEYFQNVELDYVLERLKPFLEKDKNDPEIKYKIKMKKKPTESLKTELSSFSKDKLGELELDLGIDTGISSEDDPDYDILDFVFKRSIILIITHNGMFDGKVMYHYGVELWIDIDTLQLAFNLNPKLVKGDNKLESLLLREFGVEVPSLSMILGKGNEGNYRLIDDITVACIYAGSDTDHLRPLHQRIKSIYYDALNSGFLEKDLYVKTMEQDLYHINWLYISEYYGLRVDQENFENEGKKIRARMDYLTNWLQVYVGRFVKDKNARRLVGIKLAAGESEEECVRLYQELMSKPDTPYEFKISGESLRQTLFEVMGYPIVKRNKPTKRYPEGQPAVDKDSISQMKTIKTEDTKIVKGDLYNPEEIDEATGLTLQQLVETGRKLPKGSVLVKMDDLNTAKYPIAHILSVYGDMKKEYESYFAPIIEDNLEGIISRPFSLTRIETRRIMNSLQTLKARLKKWVLGTTEDHYVVVWDKSQVEPRLMVSLSGDEEEIRKYRSPEVDYHTETASRILGIEPHTLDKDDRSVYKAVTLGIPYGLGLRKMCLNIFGEITDTNLYKTQIAIDAWKEANSAVYAKLMEFREEGLKEVDLPESYRKFVSRAPEDIKSAYGKVTNLLGFHRLFNLDNMDGEKKGKVRRPSGNFPVQAMAAELFRIIIKNLREGFEDEGILKDILMNMLVHDEDVMSVHKKVHPFQVIAIIYERCMITIKGHTNYFVGINVGENWGDGKDDSLECPVIFAERIRDRWAAGEFREDDYWNWSYTFRDSYGNLKTFKGPKGYVYEHKQEYTVQRIKEVVEESYPESVGGVLDIRELLPRFKNYMVRAYVSDFFPPNFAVEMDYKSKNFNAEELYSARFETWMLDAYGEGCRYIDFKGQEKILTRRDFTVKEEIVLQLDLDIPVTDKEAFMDSNENFWNLDTVESFDYSGDRFEGSPMTEEEWWEDNMEEHVDQRGRTVMRRKIPKKYKHLQEISGQMIIRNKNIFLKNEIKLLLKPHITKEKTGKTVVFYDGGAEVWMKIKEGYDFTEIDEVIENGHKAGKAPARR